MTNFNYFVLLLPEINVENVTDYFNSPANDVNRA